MIEFVRFNTLRERLAKRVCARSEQRSLRRAHSERQRAIKMGCLLSSILSPAPFAGEKRRRPSDKGLRYVHDGAPTAKQRFFQRLVMGRPSCVGPLSRTRATQSSDEGAALMLGR